MDDPRENYIDSLNGITQNQPQAIDTLNSKIWENLMKL